MNPPAAAAGTRRPSGEADGPYGAPNPFRAQSRRRLLRAGLLTVLAWASVAGAVALWLADGGASGFSDLAGSFAEVGIVSGFAGMDLVPLMLLLAARTPLIDATVGHDRALEFHRKLGKPALYRADFVQVSAAAQDIVSADVLATAILAGGRPMLDRATDNWDVEVIATLPDGGLLGTPGFRASR